MPKPFIERKNNAILDVIELQKEGYTDIHFQGVHLLGGSESNKPYNECFFGTLDSKGKFIESKPVYHLIGESNYDTKDSKESFIQTLQVFLNGNTLTLLNYSLLDSSLNIKLESNSKESQAILEKEKVQRKQKDKDSIQQDSQAKEYKNKESKDKDSKDKDSKDKDSLLLASNDRESQIQDSSLTASNDKSQSTSMLHPILEDNEIKCPHNGVVKLKSNKGKPFSPKGIPMVLESDLLNASIIGCTNPILSGGPCTSVAVILPSARGLKKFNDDYPIMQDLVIQLQDKNSLINIKY